MEQLGELLMTTAGACLLAYVSLFLWREYRIERFRQRIFQIRDELFDFAADGKISFDDPAYGALRGSMNSMIRFAHKMSFSHAVGVTLARTLFPCPSLEELSRERLKPLLELPEGELKESLRTFHKRALLEVFAFVAWSPLLIPMAIVATPAAFLAGKASSFYTRMTKKRTEIAETIEAQAFECDLEMGETTVRSLQPV